jgi:polysaccharide biosynthesis/export protein
MREKDLLFLAEAVDNCHLIMYHYANSEPWPGQYKREVAMLNKSGRHFGFCVFCLALVVALTGLAGCASTAYPPAPEAAASADYRYIVGPGDQINIIVWRNPEISMSVPVRPDGRISAPLVEDLQAMGKDPTTLARDIEKELSKYIRDAVVTVVVTGFVGPYSEQIRVIGEAAKPQILAYRQKMTLLDVMIAVGGITDFADGNGASILRTSDGNKQYSVRLKDLVRRGDVTANVDMKPGDVLIIPQSWF